MKRIKQVQFITGDDLERIINERLADGDELIAVDIASKTAVLMTTTIVGEIEKTALDELEDAFGRHSCGECPLFNQPTDRRCKWSVCDRGKKVTKDSRVCTAYYLTREEEESEISKDQREDARIRPQGRGCSGVAQGLATSGVRPTQWTEQIPSLGM